MTILLNEGEAGTGSEGTLPYESPVLTPVGNLRDLLAGSGSQSCDNGPLEPGPLPFSDPSCH
jgi:hypothetical protein